jgi:ABC-2 type transport system ATP-binding protein
MSAGVRIEARNLSKSFAGRTVLDGVDVQVAEGELCGVVGADGAGKTTLLRCVAGLYRPDRGSVLPGRAGRHEVGFCPQGFHMYADLTVDENVEFFGAVYGLDRATLARRSDELLHFTGLAGDRTRLAGDLSGGMRQKLTLACSVLHQPRILLLDEPTTGVDPLSRREFWQLIEVLHTSGTTIMMASAYFDEVERCQHVVFLNEGRVLASGNVDYLASGGLSLEATFRERMTETQSRRTNPKDAA